MKEFYPITIAGVKRELKLCPLNEKLYIGAFVIIGDPELTEKAAGALLEKAPEYDYILSAESKGIPLAHEMARQHKDAKYVVARKSTKLYMSDILDVEVNSITTARTQHLYIDGADAKMMRGKRVLIVDDVISTGESLKSLEALVNATGAEIVGRMAIRAEGDAADRDDIIYLEKLPLFDANGDAI